MHCTQTPCEPIPTGKNLFSLQGTPVLIAGSLFSLQGFPCKPLYFSVWDCSVKMACYSSMQRKFRKNRILFDIGTLQSLTGKYREIQGKPCNENREPAMRLGFPCNESRYFPVGIDLQGFPVSCTGFAVR